MPLLAGVVLCVVAISIYEVYSTHGLRVYFQSLTKAALPSWGRQSISHSSLNSTQAAPASAALPGALSPELANISTTHSILLSASRPDGKYFPIVFGSLATINPNILPHPTRADTWIIVAQQRQDATQDPLKFFEVACTAVFIDGILRCTNEPTVLPIAPTSGPHCTGDLAHLSFNQGPHDARVFYGPSAPYTIYGSNSAHTCFGQWMQDFRVLSTDWATTTTTTTTEPDSWFRGPLDLQRPIPYHPFEKNWFPFWDSQGHVYIHHDISPQRVFSKLSLSLDGSTGPDDLAPLARPSDDFCMAKYMPKVAPSLESIHQATNSLLITLCSRADRACRADKSNTYVITMFQHKTFHSYHSVYEPYLLLFRQDAPFEIRAISRKPFWINGRGRPGEKRPSYLPLSPSDPWNQTEMFYVTSMSWKAQAQTYHGYEDDVLFLAFGIEDEQSAGIDVVAGDLVQDLGFCDE